MVFNLSTGMYKRILLHLYARTWPVVGVSKVIFHKGAQRLDSVDFKDMEATA